MSQNVINARQIPAQPDNQKPLHERTLIIPEGEPEQTLPPLQGRETVRERVTIPGEPPRRGIRLSYSLTLAELTLRYNWLLNQHREIVDKTSRMENNIRPYADLPQEVKKFHDTMRKDCDRLIEEVNRTLTDIYNLLDSLIQGKAKPHDETLNLVLQNLRQQGERIQTLETRLRPQQR